MDNELINLDLCFGSIELLNVPPRIEGRRLYPRGRSIHRDRHGNITKDETYELGTYIENWESVAHMFGVRAPPPEPPKPWWQRIRALLC